MTRVTKPKCIDCGETNRAKFYQHLSSPSGCQSRCKRCDNRKRVEYQRRSYGPRREVRIKKADYDEIAAALTEALHLANEGWSYASDYFRDKWSFRERYLALSAIEARVTQHKSVEQQ